MTQNQATSNKPHTKVLVVSDNEQIAKIFADIINEKQLNQKAKFYYVCSPVSPLLDKMISGKPVQPLNIKTDYHKILDEGYSLVISAHCKQLFPEGLTSKVKCINLHPGFNPFNRGWYPQVFSIINGLPLGATIHEIDVELDHGCIINQEKVPVYPWDTSLDAYNRVQETEVKLLKRSIENILDSNYATTEPIEEGNLNFKKDFNALCELDLDEKLTLGQAIDRLRALTHGEFKNAYFIDPKSGKKVWVKVNLEHE